MNSTINESYSMDYEGDDANHHVINRSILQFLLYAICIFGIAFNMLILCKRTSIRQASTTRISLRLLCFMAIADSVSLASLLVVLSIQYIGIQDPHTMSIICKFDLFLIHSSSAFSIWCWLIMSAVRYVAVYKPYTHLQLNKEPLFGVAIVALMCILFELWILYDVVYVQEMRGCGDSLPVEWGKRIQLAEIVWSYFLPLILITILDMRVLCCHSVWSNKHGPLLIADSNTQSEPLQRQLKPHTFTEPICDIKQPLYAKNSIALSNQSVDRPNPSLSPSMSFSERGESPLVVHLPTNGALSASIKSRSSSKSGTPGRQKSSRRVQQLRILKRCLAIAVLDLGMNLPNYLLRLYLTLVPDDSFKGINPQLFTLIQDFSHLLYFLQFALNGLYLTGIVYQPRKKQPQSKMSGYILQNTTSKSIS
ncbi:G-PROTEIN-RECEP-F1-2 domain-containing protein [Aphelenchoides bicaudatus]|nr:G-PROTEIN-RECEP-F1-2 domain-containing protein [Aphelenchoides bicaudatus]